MKSSIGADLAEAHVHVRLDPICLSGAPRFPRLSHCRHVDGMLWGRVVQHACNPTITQHSNQACEWEGRAGGGGVLIWRARAWSWRSTACLQPHQHTASSSSLWVGGEGRGGGRGWVGWGEGMLIWREGCGVGGRYYSMPGTPHDDGGWARFRHQHSIA